MPLMIPATEMDALYDRVHALHGSRTDPSLQAEQLAFGRELLAAPDRLAEAFGRSVEAFSTYNNQWESFYPPRADPHFASRQVTRLGGTNDVAAIMARQSVVSTDDRSKGALRYIDREIVPARTTGGARFTDGRSAKQFRRLDLLLADTEDRAPIIAEVKVGGDQHPFYGLIQSLMLAALLVTPHQRARLVRHYPDAFSDEGPAEICLLLAGHRHDGRYRRELGTIADQLSAELMRHGAVSEHLQRIECFDVELQVDRLALTTRFAHDG